MIIVNEISSNDFLVKSKLPSADYVCNPYVGCTHKCIYCYAEFMKRFTNHLEEWGEFIDVKNYKTYKLPRNIENKYVFISSVTDPYNHYEKKYKKTRKALESLIDVNCEIGILTKSNLVLRDIDIFKQMKKIEVGVSVNTLDDVIRKDIEPFAGTVNDRIETLKQLRINGIKNYLFMSPMFPDITDYKDIIRETKEFVDYYCFENLNLRAAYKWKVLKYIKYKHRNLYDVYSEIYEQGATEYWENLKIEIEDYCRKNDIKYKMYFHHDSIKKV